MSIEQISAIIAVASALASGLSAYFGVRLLLKRAEQACDRRIEALREGISIGQKTHPTD